MKIKSKNNYKGFTLIELLVVVLIIGILAAIALPQYQLTVSKSKYTAMMNIINAVGQAQEEYYLVHNKYSKNCTDLSIEKPQNTSTYSLICDGSYASAYLLKGPDFIASYVYYYHYSSSSNKQRTMCITYSANKHFGDKLCKSLGGILLYNNNGSCGNSGNTVCNQYTLHFN